MFVIRQQNMGTQLVFKWLGHWSRGVFYQEACWGGDYCGGDFGSVEDCYGCMAVGNSFRRACLRVACRGTVAGDFRQESWPRTLWSVLYLLINCHSTVTTT